MGRTFEKARENSAINKSIFVRKKKVEKGQRKEGN